MNLFWMVVWIVLMLLWLFSGSYYIYGLDRAGPAAYGATLIPWFCVAIIGYMLFGGTRGNPPSA